MSMLDYQRAIEYLYTSQPVFHLVGSSAYNPGLANTYRLMEHLGDPHKKIRSIHIAGTNGKGSTSHLISAVLQAQGYKVGLFTSPHLVDFRERIRISGEMISKEAVVQYVAENRAFLDELCPSFFETTMAMAFWYFAQQEVDIAVVEVGLGGRLDSTNILNPLLSIITNIGIDHTEILGQSLSEIAEEKAGIIKPNTPCVIGETHPETFEIFLGSAERAGILGGGVETTDCRIWFADQCGYMRKRRLKEVPDCQLKGLYQDKNQQTAFVALQVLRNYCGISVSAESISKGYAYVCDLTGLRGRWEQLNDKPITICDTGHNSHGIRYIVDQLETLIVKQREHHPSALLHIVFGMVNDKDIDAVLNLLPENARYYFTQPSTSRALSADELQKRWQVIHPTHFDNQCYTSVETAVLTAQKEASNEDVIFIGGSNYVVSVVLGMCM